MNWRPLANQVLPGALMLLAGMALTRVGSQRLRRGMAEVTGSRRKGWRP